MVSDMLSLIVENIRTFCIIYAIGALVTFIGVILFFVYICKAEDKENELYSDDDSREESAAGTVVTMCIGTIIAFGCAILWCAIPILILVLIFMYAISKRFPNIMGKMIDDEETED